MEGIHWAYIVRCECQHCMLRKLFSYRRGSSTIRQSSQQEPRVKPATLSCQATMSLNQRFTVPALHDKSLQIPSACFTDEVACFVVYMSHSLCIPNIYPKVYFCKSICIQMKDGRVFIHYYINVYQFSLLHFMFSLCY